MEKKKYILEVEEDPTTIRLVKLKNGEGGLPCMQFVAVSPYKYDEAYKRGRKDAIDEIGCNEKEIATKACQSGLDDGKKMGMELIWEVARKIILPSKRGGFTIDEFAECFGSDVSKYDVVEHYSASEAIEKILQYEQEKEEKITKGDVVRIKSTPEIEIFVTYADEEHVSGIALTEVDGCCEIGDQYTGIVIHKVEKTGRHYEIAEVLQKMQKVMGK